LPEIITAGALHRRNFVDTAFEKLTITNVLGGTPLTPSVYTTARYAEITVDGSPLRWTADGSAPSLTRGHYAQAFSNISLTSNEAIQNFRATYVSGRVFGTIQATYKEIKNTA
jgi:hypothetical protein